MPELRKDLLTDNWVIIAEERNNRPKDYSRQEGLEQSPENCPFDPGNESMTPPEIDTIETNDHPESDWTVRVVPNKFNALSPEENLTHNVDGLLQSMNATGSHEVIIETPEHDKQLSDFSDSQMEAVLRMFCRRISNLLSDNRFYFVQVFRNEGREAGASLVHPHSQILAFPFIPLWIKERLRTTYHYFTDRGNCILCDYIEQESEKDQRIIKKTDKFIVLAPYASRYPYETWILPRKHSHDFTGMPKAELSQLSTLLPEIVDRLRRTLTDPPFNILLHTAPDSTGLDNQPQYASLLQEHFHWHLELIPRLKQTAGLELATDTHINSVSPERSAEILSKV